MKNNINRSVNCETANLTKTLNAAIAQIDSIKYIRDTVGLNQLPAPLREVALARLSSPPECTLAELGKQLVPPLGKSGVNHRLKKIGEYADRLKKQRGDSYEKTKSIRPGH